MLFISVNFFNKFALYSFSKSDVLSVYICGICDIKLTEIKIGLQYAPVGIRFRLHVGAEQCRKSQEVKQLSMQLISLSSRRQARRMGLITLQSQKIRLQLHLMVCGWKASRGWMQRSERGRFYEYHQLQVYVTLDATQKARRWRTCVCGAQTTQVVAYLDRGLTTHKKQWRCRWKSAEFERSKTLAACWPSLMECRRAIRSTHETRTPPRIPLHHSVCAATIGPTAFAK